MKKRILAFTMALVLLFSMLPAVAFAATSDTRYLKLMANTDKELLLESVKGAPVYTKNVPATFTDEGGATFSGWAQELTTVTDEATDEWNLKFFYSDAQSRWTAVLKGAKLDAYNDETKKSVKNAYCLVGQGSESYSYDFRLEIHQDSYLEGKSMLMANGSNRWTSVNIVSKNNATLYGKTTYYGIHAQRSVFITANLDCYGNGNSFIYINNSDTNRNITFYGGTIKLDNYYQFSSAKTYPLKLNGGSITLTNASVFATYASLEVKEGLCYQFTDLQGNPVDPTTMPADKGMIFQSYPQHILEGDDSDCTVASTCSHCGAQTEARSEHEAATDDGDCTTAVTCLYCSVVMTEAKDAHEAGDDDNNCATAVKCINCDKAAIEAKEHVPGEDDDNCMTPVKCVNCEEYAVLGEAQHTPGGDPISHTPANCTQDGEYIYKCDKCEEIFTVTDPSPGHDYKLIDALVPTANSRGYNTYKCDVCGDSYTDELFMLPTVAMIGKVRYTSLQDAIDAAAEGDTIKLMNSKKDMATVVIAAGKNLTIDFNGNYYAVSQVSQAAAMVIEAGAEVKLIDTVGGGKLEAMHSAYTQFNTLVNNAGNLTVENVILNGGNLAVVGSATMINSGILRLKEGTVVNVNRSTKNSLINTGDFYCASSSILPAPEGYHWNAEGMQEEHFHIPTQMPATVYEVAYILYKCECSHSYKIPFGDKKLGVAARIGDKLYATLQEAVDAAEDGGTIILNKNLKNVATVIIPANKKVTIDMNGKYYAVSIVKQGAALVIEEGAELNLISTGSNTDVKAKWEAMSVSHKEFTCAVINNGKLTLENVTINGNNLLKTCEGVIVNSGEVILNRASSIVTKKAKSNISGNGIIVDNGSAYIPTPPMPEGNTNTAIGAITTADELVFYKASSHGASLTVSPGKAVSYSVVVANTGSDSKTVTITDEIPAEAEYVSGCDNVSGNQMKWEFTLAAKESKTITYVLKAKDDRANLGKALEGNAKVNNITVPFHKVYIALTLGNQDQVIMETAIDAFRQSTGFDGLEIARWMYYVAFTQSVAYHDADGKTLAPTAVLDQIYGGGGSSGGTDDDGEEAGSAAVKFKDTVVPTLYGGKGVGSVSGFMGQKATQVTKGALMTGDVVLVQESSSDTTGKAYIYNGIRLFLLDDGVVDADTDSVLNALADTYRYAVLRVSFVMPNRIDYIDPVELNLTDAQKAIIATAEAYLLRGDRGQYDVGTTMGPDTRYTHGQGSPEDYTSDYTRYSNCSDFTYNCAYFGLGYSGGNNYHTTHIINTAKSQGVFYYEPTGNETEAERAEKEKQFVDTLQPGDVIIVRRTINTGHAMLYIGNEMIIHSTGANYKTAGTGSSNSGLSYGVETHEATFRYRHLRDLFNPNASAGTYVFSGTVSQLGIYRPLAKFNGTVSAEGMNRVNNMQGIVVEKIGSLSFGHTANVGDQITYTFNFLNTNSVSKTVEITDVIPEGTTLVSAPGWTVSGSDLSCNLTIPAGEKAEIAFTVMVGSSVPDNKIVSASAKVGGVTVKASTIYVANTLTAVQQQILINTITTLSGSSKRGLELVNEIYNVAFGVEQVFAYTTVSDFYKQMYTTSSKYSFLDNEYTAMVAPGLFGGLSFSCDDDTAKGVMTRYPRAHQLMIGDIIFGRSGTGTSLYIYLGDDALWNLTSNQLDTQGANLRLERIYGFKYYWAVLRPSMTLDI